MVLALITAAALFGFVWAGERIVHERWLLNVPLVVPIWGITPWWRGSRPWRRDLPDPGACQRLGPAAPELAGPRAGAAD